MKEFSNKPNTLVTTIIREDGSITAVWDNRDLGAVVIARDTQNRILIMQRGKDVSFAGKFGLPSGFIDWNETLEQCAERELFEETGISIEGEDRFQLLGIDSSFNNPNKQSVVAFYFIQLTEYESAQSLQPQDGESENLRWVSLNEISEIPSDQWIGKTLHWVSKIK